MLTSFSNFPFPGVYQRGPLGPLDILTLQLMSQQEHCTSPQPTPARASCLKGRLRQASWARCPILNHPAVRWMEYLDDPGLGHVLASEFRNWNQPHQNLKAQELGRNGTYRKTKSLLTTMTISHVTTLAVKTAALGFENDHMLCLNYMNSSVDQRLL